MGAFFNRYGTLTAWLLVILPVLTFLAWFGFAVLEFQTPVDTGVRLTHDWLNWLIDVSLNIPFLNWLCQIMVDWQEGLPTDLWVKATDMDNMGFFKIWLTWVFTFFGLWLLLVAITTLIGIVFGLSFRASGGGGGGGGGTTTTVTTNPSGLLQLALHYLRAPVVLALMLVVLGTLGFWFFDKVVDKYESFTVGHTYQERLAASAVECVPGDSNVLLLGQVDQCAGLYLSSTASEPDKEALKVVLGITCVAYDGYAKAPSSTPTWEQREPRQLEPKAYGEKAQWIADQGIPCSLPDSNEPAPKVNRVPFFFFVFLVPIVLVTALQVRNPITDGAGTQLPFSEQWKRGSIRVVVAVMAMAAVYILLTSIF